MIKITEWGEGEKAIHKLIILQFLYIFLGVKEQIKGLIERKKETNESVFL